MFICLDDDGSNVSNSVISTTVNATPNPSTQNETCVTSKERVAESDVVSQLGIKHRTCIWHLDDNVKNKFLNNYTHYYRLYIILKSV